MLFSFAEALRAIYGSQVGGYQNAVLYLAAETRPPSSYVLNNILPNRNRNDYQARSGSMTIRTTMAGLVGMDSDYPEGGLIESSAFSEQVAKMAIKATLREQQLRELQMFVQQAMLNRASNQTVSNQMAVEAINFYEKVVLQALSDAEEYLKGCALFTGGIDWTFNGIRLLVDYGIPTANTPPQRTGANGYGGASSQFWADMRFHRRQQKTGIATIIMHPETADLIQYNDANRITLTSDPLDMDRRTWRRMNPQNGDLSKDGNDTVQVLTYGLEGEVFDPQNPGKTVRVPFVPRGVVASFGRNQSSQYVVGGGSTPAPTYELGYGHVAPTTEGGGAPGRWGQLYTPENEPWQLIGRGAENFLPVIESPDKIVLTTTDGL